MKIAIVGFGVSGAGLLMSMNAAGKLTPDVKVDIFDPREELAVGLAYGKDSNHLLVNAFPTAMSLDPENKYDFSEWLERHYPKYESRVDLVPRPIFGEYATERLTPLVEKENITHYAKEIIDVVQVAENTTESYLLTDSKGQPYGNYDYLFLAVGNAAYNDFYDLEGTENYIGDPYPVIEKLAFIQSDTRVAILGSSLTAFDLVNYLSHEKKLIHPMGVFTVVPHFNSLRVPPYQGPALQFSLDEQWRQEMKREYHGVIPLDQMLDRIKKDLEENAIDLEEIRKQYDPTDLPGTYQVYFKQEHPELSKLQAYISLLAGHLADLFMSMTKEDFNRYQRDYAPLFRHYRVRLAPDAVKNMYHRLQADELFIVPDLKNIQQTTPFILESASGETYEADVVINATGFDFNTDRISDEQPLLRNLLDKGFLLDKEKRGILVSWPESQVINQQDGTLENCFFIGPWISNTHFGNNNVNALVKKADEIVQNYLNF